MLRTKRQTDENTEVLFTIKDCWLGKILVAKSRQGVCSIMIGDHADTLIRDLRSRYANARAFPPGDPEAEQLATAVAELSLRPVSGFNLPCDLRGTAFQKRVWQALKGINPGATASYTEVAQRIGAPTAVRAVARACADNPLALVIPCHRVVRRDGGLSGYRWGVERKRQLLQLESA